MVDDEHRVDLFLSFHGSETLSCGFTTRQLMRHVVEAVTTRARSRGATPSIFFDEENVRGHVPSDIFTAVLQLRGGGFGLCLITPRFFDFPWCLAEVAALLRTHRDRRNAVRLRFMCLDCKPEDVLYHENVRYFIDELRAHSMLPSVSVYTCSRAVEQLTDFIFTVWDGHDGLADRRPSVLGRTRHESMNHLQQFYLHPDSQCTLQTKEKALLSYHTKWEESKHFPWDFTQLDNLCSMFQHIRLTLLDMYNNDRDLYVPKSDVQCNERHRTDDMDDVDPFEGAPKECFTAADPIQKRISPPPPTSSTANKQEPRARVGIDPIAPSK